ncbi:MAG: leucine dehydrogenase [Flammeovirgaceae bacterium]|nr:leucine dehydrogenase [Flammeovirgaceae bacterium]
MRRDSIKLKSQTILDKMWDMSHEQLVFCSDHVLGLKAIISIHNTVLGPAMGGTRMWDYTSEIAAIEDVLRLSRGMTFKNSIAGLNIGGGKAVIIGDAKKIKGEKLMRRFGEFVNGLGGQYWTAEDVNMTTQDMEYIRMETPYVAGLSEKSGGSGDPSPVTAYGVFCAMKACAKKVYGSDILVGKKILVQGLGNVGSYLIELLIKEQAHVLVSDLFNDKIKSIAERFKVTVVAVNEVYGAEVDIYAPCALGATINSQTIPMMNCKIIAGGANNQLADETLHAKMLNDKGILYGPDFLINSGGIINVYFEQQGNYNKAKVLEKTEDIYKMTTDVINLASVNQITTHQAALNIAKKRIEDFSRLKSPTF